MAKNIYTGPDRRKFVRLDYVAPLAYKVCKKKTVSKILQGYTVDISQAGLLCNFKDKVHKNDILWFAFDRATLAICEDMERRSLVYQNGIVGKVVRIEPKKKDGTYTVGVQFLTREEKNLTHIYPKIHFLKMQGKEIFRNLEDEKEEIEEEPAIEREYEAQEEDQEQEKV